MRLIRGACVATALAVVTVEGTAQTPLFRHVEDGVARTAERVFGSADMDADGDVDLVVYENEFHKVAVHKNEGGGRFRADPIFDLPIVGPLVTFGAVADFDGDGLPDLVISTPGYGGTVGGGGAYPGTLRFYRNAPGGFVLNATEIMPPLTAGICSACFIAVLVTLGDFDGDGLVDVVGSYYEAVAAMGYFRSVIGAPFTFVSGSVPATANYHLDQILAADFDGDGDLDLLTRPTYFTRSVLVNAGGTFTFGPAYTTPNGVDSIPVGIGDMDGDGVTEMIIGRSDGFGGSFDEIVSLASFATPVVASFVRSTPARKIGGADFDGDGLPEIIREGGGPLDPGTVEIHAYPTGASIFAAPPSTGMFATLDADGDGDVDLVTADADSLKHVRLNVGGVFKDVTGGLPSPFGVELLFGSQRRFCGPLADLDGNGVLDVVAPTVIASVGAAMNDGLGRFSLGPFSAPALTSFAYISGTFAAGDLDADGDDEVVEVTDTAITTYYPSGGAWSISSVPSLGGGRSMVLADLDGDLDLDLAYASGGVFGVCYAINQGGVLGFPTGLGPSKILVDIAAVDVDGDLDLDLVIAAAPNQPPATAVPSILYLNQGGGVFLPTTPFAAPDRVSSVAAGDVDGDGDADLVLGDVIRLNLGNGTFVNGGVLAAPTPLYTFPRRRLVDLDQDGFLDLLGAETIQRGLGNGSFAPTEPILSSPTASSWGNVHHRFWSVGDLDRDGDLDLLHPNGYVVWNTLRHLAYGAIPVTGEIGSLEIYGEAFAPWILFISTAPASPAFELPPWGTVQINPLGAVIAGQGTLDSAGAAKAVFGVPAGPTFLGLQLWSQVFLPAQMRLTGAEHSVVLGV